MQQIIECVPNFSEGRNPQIINAIRDAIETIDGIRILDIDSGKATNRTVLTFLGPPNEVIEAAFCGIQKAAELIDMRQHSGAHPRMGSTDVCPLIPIAGITMAETAIFAKKLAKRVADELSIPAYLYEYAQDNPARKNLSNIRSGEYEGFFEKIKHPDWKPDFGKSIMNIRAGATVFGARDFLIAFNINLNTQSTRLANRVAFDVREAGRVKREGNPYTGSIVKDKNGEDVRIPGKLKSVKAIGWYIEEYKMAQISMNLTNTQVTPMHIAFEETRKAAYYRGLRVTGAELVGLIPLEPMLEAGRYFLKKQGLSCGVCEADLIDSAVRSMGLAELGIFDPNKKIVEYFMRNKTQSILADMTLSDFVDETARDSAAPGGGSIAALSGALGAALGTMVANLSAIKKGWETRLDEFSPWSEQGQIHKTALVSLIDEDTRAFDQIMQAYGLPKDNDIQINSRKKAIQDASKYATEVPFLTMQTAFSCIPMLKQMAEHGNPNSLSDVGVGILCIKTAVRGAWLNVLINAKNLDDTEWASNIVSKARTLLAKNHSMCDEIVNEIEKKLSA
ncbi:MAG: glutamate formimidoyltransferase [Flavobacteriales bacterium]|nr:MAG: glutamate formimidoyltransferase [Flavobacteriales bacterium]